MHDPVAYGPSSRVVYANLLRVLVSRLRRKDGDIDILFS